MGHPGEISDKNDLGSVLLYTQAFENKGAHMIQMLLN